MSSYYKSGDEVRAAEAIVRALKKQADALMLQINAGQQISDETLHNLRLSSNSLGNIGALHPPTIEQLNEIADDIERLQIMVDREYPVEVLAYEARELRVKLSLLEILSDRQPLREKVQLDLPPYEEEEEETEEVDTSFIGKIKRKVKGK